MIEPNNRYTIIVSINKRLNEITNMQYITVDKIAKYFNFDQSIPSLTSPEPVSL